MKLTGAVVSKHSSEHVEEGVSEYYVVVKVLKEGAQLGILEMDVKPEFFSRYVLGKEFTIKFKLPLHSTSESLEDVGMEEDPF